MKYKLGIDLGGTKSSVVVLDQNNQAVYNKRMPTPARNYTEILNTIQQLVNQAQQAIPDLDAQTIGVGIPGALQQDNLTVKNANTQILIGKKLKTNLETVLQRSVIIANDANCFATSEATDGSAKGHAVVFGVILGTGVGGGIAVMGKPWEGPNRLAGEWGHNPFPFHGAEASNKSCYCGKSDCIEKIISGPALSQDYFEQTGKHKSAKQIADAMVAGDPFAIRLFQDFYLNLAKALSTVINLLDPNVIVLGGGLSNIAAIYHEVPKLWDAYVFDATGKKPNIATKLVKNKWGDDSGVRGAAWLTDTK